MAYIVKLEDGVWLARWHGDPGRTLKVQTAKWFETEGDAYKALSAARKLRPFAGAKVEYLYTEQERKA